MHSCQVQNVKGTDGGGDVSVLCLSLTEAFDCVQHNEPWWRAAPCSYLVQEIASVRDARQSAVYMAYGDAVAGTYHIGNISADNDLIYRFISLIDTCNDQV